MGEIGNQPVAVLTAFSYTYTLSVPQIASVSLPRNLYLMSEKKEEKKRTTLAFEGLFSISLYSTYRYHTSVTLPFVSVLRRRKENVFLFV